MLASGFIGVRRIQFVGRFVRRLSIFARKIGISDIRPVVFGMFGIFYEQRNPKIQCGWALRWMVASGFLAKNSRGPTQSSRRPMIGGSFAPAGF